jgi:hypothetical protein
MLAHGFKIELLVELVRAGLATASTERLWFDRASEVVALASNVPVGDASSAIIYFIAQRTQS